LTASRRLWCIFASLAVSGGLAVAQSNQPAPPVQQPNSWLEEIWNLPVFRWLSGRELPAVPDVGFPDVDSSGGTAQTAEVEPPIPPCDVEPVPPITDLDALAFEAKSSLGSGPVVDLEGLTPRTSSALWRFENVVSSHGGSMVLTSAYRPEGYQQHLREVWHKWMDELRDNTDPACASLKADVGAEFTRHQLLPTQPPVPVSDHTLGIGFDAAVQFPVAAARGRRRIRVSLDRLAHLAGMMRPDILHDPVHYRLIGGRRV
jgi:hypothetical protein